MDDGLANRTRDYLYRIVYRECRGGITSGHSPRTRDAVVFWGPYTVAGKHRETRWLDADMMGLVRGYKGCPGRSGIWSIKA